LAADRAAPSGRTLEGELARPRDGDARYPPALVPGDVEPRARSLAEITPEQHSPAREHEPVTTALSIPPKSASQALPEGALLLDLLGVSYVHVRTREGGDLYVVADALSFVEHLQPENWLEHDWFAAHSERLRGTSAVYAVPTKPVRGERIDLVMKYCRVGQYVPFETLQHDVVAEFNGPFEEFSLLEETRRSTRGTLRAPIVLQSPLAIYVPPERLQLWQTGRSEATIASKIARYPGVAIDILRDYILIYRWLEGCDALQAHEKGLLTEPEMEQLTLRATSELEDRGYRVLDMKPHHVIVRRDPQGGLRRRATDGELDYGLIDFELLERTPEHQAEVRELRQQDHLRRQRPVDSASTQAASPPLPAHLASSDVFGVEYTFGRVESTGGALWVVGSDPALFDYFLPERWRQTPHIQLDPQHSTFYTRSKDAIQLVWKVSRVGEPQCLECTDASAMMALEHGVNSPFEDVALAAWLRRGGVLADAPYAIYMTGHDSGLEHRTLDWRRYRSHEHLRTPNGESALRPERNYITLWSFGGGPEIAREYQDSCSRALNGEQALARQLLTLAELTALLEEKRSHIEATGITVLKLLPRQILLSLDSQGALLRDASGHLEMRLCSFDFLKLPAAVAGHATDVAPFVPPGVLEYGAVSATTDLHALLSSNRDVVVANTFRRVRASGAPHYAAQSDEEVHRRIGHLMTALLESTESASKRRHAFVDHMRRIAEHRIREGFSVAEVQLQLGCLQEEAWTLCAGKVSDRDDLLRCLTSITSIVSQAKDELALLFLERKHPVGDASGVAHTEFQSLFGEHGPAPAR
jgi:hypothetical protein